MATESQALTALLPQNDPSIVQDSNKYSCYDIKAIDRLTVNAKRVFQSTVPTIFERISERLTDFRTLA
jgi:hypothetical protein